MSENERVEHRRERVRCVCVLVYRLPLGSKLRWPWVSGIFEVIWLITHSAQQRIFYLVLSFGSTLHADEDNNGTSIWQLCRAGTLSNTFSILHGNQRHLRSVPPQEIIYVKIALKRCHSLSIILSNASRFHFGVAPGAARSNSTTTSRNVSWFSPPRTKCQWSIHSIIGPQSPATVLSTKNNQSKIYRQLRYNA